MNPLLKIILYIVLLSGTCLTAFLGYQESKKGFTANKQLETELNIAAGEESKGIHSEKIDSSSSNGEKSRSQAKMISLFMASTLLCLLSAFLFARDIAAAAAEKATNVIYNTDAGVLNSEEYERAEEACVSGNYLEAIDLMRAFYNKNKSEVYAARRIAEIYEKDLENYAAAAQEYEDLLKLPLPSKRWGWMAIHLCNLYTGKLNNSERAISLLQEIVINHTATPAGKKAKETLEKLGYEIEVLEDEDEGGSENSRPTGFAPKN